jgi:hypothetical protein
MARRPASRAFLPAAAILALVAGAACRGGAVAGAAAGPNPFAASPLWDDGRAEIDAYEATIPRYGIPRSLTAYLIVVKEDFSRKQLVKADPDHEPADLFTVLKLNQVINYQTGIYSYHQMESSFFDRASMEMVKLSLTSNEWCGNTYKEYTRHSGRAALHVRTYWDNQAEATYDLPVGPDVVFYDALPLWIRSLPQTPGTARSLRLVPTQIESRGPKPEIAPVVLVAAREETKRVPAGAFRTLRWELKPGAGRPDIYWTSREQPYVLVAWERADGGSFRLKWTQRLAYWTLNRPGDERYLVGPAAGSAPARRP